MHSACKRKTCLQNQHIPAHPAAITTCSLTVEFRQHTPAKLAVEGEGRSWWCIRIGSRNCRLVPGSPPLGFGWWSQEAHGQSAPMPLPAVFHMDQDASTGSRSPMLHWSMLSYEDIILLGGNESSSSRSTRKAAAGAARRGIDRHRIGCMLVLPDAGLLALDRTRTVLGSGHVTIVESSNPEAVAPPPRSQEHADPAHWGGAPA